MNVLVKMSAGKAIDEVIAMWPKIIIVNHPKTHVVPRQTPHMEVSRLATNIEFKKTVENLLVKCDQKIHSVEGMGEFKKTGDYSQCNVDSPGRPQYCGIVCGA